MLGDVERQWRYEETTDHQAAANKLKELREAAAAGDPNTSKAKILLARMSGDVERVIEAYKTPSPKGGGGIGAMYKKWLRALPTDLAASIAIRECIANCSVEDRRMTKVQNLAERVGKLYELEVRIRQAEQVNPLYIKKIEEQIKERCTTAQRHIRKVYDFAIKQVLKGEIEFNLTRTDMIHLGKFGVDACVQAGLIEKHVGKCSTGISVDYLLHPDIKAYLNSYDELDVRRTISKDDTRMYCPPEEWTSIMDGGYLTPRRKAVAPMFHLRGVRKSDRARVAAEFNPDKMPLVFNTGNYLQSIPYHIHEATREAIQRVWLAGGGLLGVPRRNPPAAPQCPMAPEWVKADGTPEELDQFMAWKKAMARHYEDMKVWRGRVREVGSFIKNSRDDDVPIWFPTFMDSRGRWYYRGVPNPQGSDIAKSVLHFWNKKPLGKRGLYWLKVCIANHYGYDKERFDERARWTEQHWPIISAALDCPEDHPEVWGDSPWCMFSAAWELRAALATGHPEEYCTGVVCHMDATCSGLQHFSAMLRDPVGASYVNLVDTQGCGPKQDIYTRVATAALLSVAGDLNSDDPVIRRYAEFWTKQKIDRKMAKKPVMTYVYGATLKGTAEFIEDYALHDLGVEFPVVEPNESYQFCLYAARKLFRGIELTVPAAAAAMRWLCEVARDTPRGRAIEWHTPTGMLVVHDYRASNVKRVMIRSCGVQYIAVKEWLDDTKPLEMRNAIAPNFVHSMDASHLCLTAERMRVAGLSFCGIHDSFGTHASDVDTLHANVRDSFIELYSKRNTLGELLWEIGIVGETPMRGDFDINLVADSEFFFC